MIHAQRATFIKDYAWEKYSFSLSKLKKRNLVIYYKQFFCWRHCCCLLYNQTCVVSSRGRGANLIKWTIFLSLRRSELFLIKSTEKSYAFFFMRNLRFVLFSSSLFRSLKRRAAKNSESFRPLLCDL